MESLPFSVWINVANRFASASGQKANCCETHLHLFAVHLRVHSPTLAPEDPPATNCPCLRLIVFVFSSSAELGNTLGHTFAALVFIIIFVRFFAAYREKLE